MTDDLAAFARYPNFTQAAEHKIEDTRVTLQRATEISRAVTQAEDAAAAAMQAATQVRAAAPEGHVDMAMSEIQRLQALLQSRQGSSNNADGYGSRPASRQIDADAPDSGSRPRLDDSAPSSNAVGTDPAANQESLDNGHSISAGEDSGTVKQVGPLLAQSIEATALLAQQMLQTAQFMESGSQMQSGMSWLKAVPLVAGSQREEALQKLLTREDKN
eukprot:TRINITY_DN46403_c0_g1_i1.p1 TRINITY_DN46403_c0_g1~~TRINITY_DN46403_c0_g1_i1.p1  ORF type:complete len:217 (-),score=48.82 TRINITY_DN46403_c0_g1_i1:197-847(-)